MSANTLPIGQASIFEPEPLYDTQVVSSIDGKDVVTTYGIRGSYVNVVERAGHLVMALEAISERNRRDGLSLAAYTAEYSAPIWATYQENTPGVLDGASNNRTKYQNQLRRSFWQATGFAALRGSHLIREPQINPRAQKMWRDFNDAYGSTRALKARNKYKAQLKNTVVLK